VRGQLRGAGHVSVRHARGKRALGKQQAAEPQAKEGHAAVRRQRGKGRR
jgi:hypothetical protein